jgi:hypothetical protein
MMRVSQPLRRTEARRHRMEDATVPLDREGASPGTD